jgi:transcriptional regulator with XRE-family HTH domain
MSKRGKAKPGVVKEAPPIVKQLFERADAVNISMLAVCKRAKVHHDVVGRWRRGQTSPTVKTVEKIIKALQYFERNPPVIPL